jgi:hypothetical protein
MLKLVVTEKTYRKDFPWHLLFQEEMKNILCSIDIESDDECPITGNYYEEYKLANDTDVKFYSLGSTLFFRKEEVSEKDHSNDCADLEWLTEIIQVSPYLFRQRFKELEAGSYLLETRHIGDDDDAEIKIVGMRKEA